MSTAFGRRMLLFSLSLLFAPAGLARAGDDEEDEDEGDDHERAHRAVERGRARPLAEILARVRDKLTGELVGVEFERKKGRYVYELKVITSAGRVSEVYVDAMTAEIVERKED